VAADSPITLCSLEALKSGAFADLVQAFDDPTLLRILAQATRACETEVDRRLAPFVDLTETHRLDGIDPDEYGPGNLPTDLAGVLGRSYNQAINAGSESARHLWLKQAPAHYPDMWKYSDIRISVARSYGGTQEFQIGQFHGPDVDTGHVWFRLGTWLPVGSYATVTYSGGYQTVPADLERACKWMAASICCRELTPMQANDAHDASELEALAVSWMSPYMRTS
jgi:hypothetical protein